MDSRRGGQASSGEKLTLETLPNGRSAPKSGAEIRLFCLVFTTSSWDFGDFLTGSPRHPRITIWRRRRRLSARRYPTFGIQACPRLTRYADIVGTRRPMILTLRAGVSPNSVERQPRPRAGSGITRAAMESPRPANCARPAAPSSVRRPSW